MIFYPILMTYPDFSLEQRLWQRGYKVVIGVDEVGRGSFAGPVVAAAAAVRIQNSVPIKSGSETRNQNLIEEINKLGINDSKKLSAKKREEVAGKIKKYFFWATGEADVYAINNYGIVTATEMAVRKAVVKLLYQAIKQIKGRKVPKLITRELIESIHPYLLLDAFQVKYVPVIGLKYQQVVVHGDQKCCSIAAASVIAKVYRDNLMARLAKLYPSYGWEKNAGYGTEDHRSAIAKNGITRLHRKQFVRRCATLGTEAEYSAITI